MRNEAAVLGLILSAHFGVAVAQDAQPVPIPPEESAAPAAPAETAPAEAAATETAPAEAAPAEATAVAAEPAPADAAPEVEESSAAPASTSDAFHYLGVLGTYSFLDSGRNNNGSDLDDAAGVSVLYGYQRADHWGFEVQAFMETLETSRSLGTDWYRWGGNLDLTYSFGDRTGFTPFVLAGVGGNMDDVSPLKDKFTWFGNIGAGFATAPLANVGDLRVRGEVRGLYDDFQDGFIDIRVALGIEIPLFGKRGVGAAAPALVQESVRIVEVPTGLLDGDGDGVVDEKDKCPGTPAGTRVDGDGCPYAPVTVLKGVNFEIDSDRLRPDAKAILDTLVETLKAQPGMKVEIAGHTDSSGSEAYNLKLSDKRAASVRQYLVEHSIPADQVSSKGYGESQPVADNATAEGREQNRRVEWRILN